MLTAKEIEPGDVLYLTNAAAKDNPELAQMMWSGGTVEKTAGDVVEIKITRIERIHVSRLTKGEDAYDPVL